MSAAEALKSARAAGVHITADGEDLILDAESPPPAPIVDALKRYKPEIVALLTRSAGDWSAEEWGAFLHERAAIIEFDGGLSRAEAEASAYEWCIVEWLNRNPAPSESGLCAWCQQPEGGTSSVVVPFGTDEYGHTWLHHRCWKSWHDDRRKRARKYLADIDIR